MERMTFTRHLHTVNHETPGQRVSVADIARRYERVDALVIEDHGHFQLPAGGVDAHPGPLVLPGREWATPVHRGKITNKHHVGILGVDRFEQSRLAIRAEDDPARMAAKVHQADGALVLNHPEYPYIDKAGSSARALAYTLPIEEARAFDAIELFNDVGFAGSDPTQVLGWVERNFYARGLYPAMVGGQDDHGPKPVAKAPSYTVAMVERRDEAGLMAAVRAGRTFVSKSLDATLDLQLDGRSAWEGQSPGPGSHHLSVALAGLPEGARVEVVRTGQVIATASAPGGGTRLDLDLPASTAAADYVYVRAWSAAGILHTVSSALPLPRMERLPLIP